MRRVAAELSVATMSLYRHVHGKEDLLRLMTDAVFARYPLPSTPPAGWRARLELVARLQWHICRTHPWVARAVSLTRPQLAPNAMAHTEWSMRVMRDLGLNPQAMMHVAVLLTGFTVGLGAQLEGESEAEQHTGVTSDEWMVRQDAMIDTIRNSGRFPVLSSVTTGPEFAFSLDTLFDFGLTVLLDGLAARFGPAAAG